MFVAAYHSNLHSLFDFQSARPLLQETLVNVVLHFHVLPHRVMHVVYPSTHAFFLILRLLGLPEVNHRIT